MRTVRADRQRTTEAIFGIWSLFAALTLLMLGNGLQGSLVGVNTQSLGFSSLVTAVVMASYFVGFLGGSFAVPKLVLRVGHVRVFASLASAASVAALAYSISGDPVTWGVMRFITGACFAGLYVVAESWIHSRATNATRGRLMAIYMVIVLGAAGVGQLLLNVSDPEGFELFVLSSVLISLAVVPVSLARSPTPDFEFESRSSLGDLVRRSPLGVVAGVLTGAANAAILGMGAVYGVVAGMTTFQITVFMASTLAGGVPLHLRYRRHRRPPCCIRGVRLLRP
jgi:MFS family permease